MIPIYLVIQKREREMIPANGGLAPPALQTVHAANVHGNMDSLYCSNLLRAAPITPFRYTYTITMRDRLR